MFRFWKRHCWFRLRGTDLEGEIGIEDRRRLLSENIRYGKYLFLPRTNMRSRSRARGPAGKQDRYMSFGIGGAGNIRRWVKVLLFFQALLANSVGFIWSIG